jgi:hypothetical protein
MTFSPASSFCLSWTNSSLSFNDRFDRRHRAFPFYATQRSHQACNRSVFTSACDICCHLSQGNQPTKAMK